MNAHFCITSKRIKNIPPCAEGSRKTWMIPNNWKFWTLHSVRSWRDFSLQSSLQKEMGFIRVFSTIGRCIMLFYHGRSKRRLQFWWGKRLLTPSPEKVQIPWSKQTSTRQVATHNGPRCSWIKIKETPRFSSKDSDVKEAAPQKLDFGRNAEMVGRSFVHSGPNG